VAEGALLVVDEHGQAAGLGGGDEGEQGGASLALAGGEQGREGGAEGARIVAAQAGADALDGELEGVEGGVEGVERGGGGEGGAFAALSIDEATAAEIGGRDAEGAGEGFVLEVEQREGAISERANARVFLRRLIRRGARGSVFALAGGDADASLIFDRELAVAGALAAGLDLGGAFDEADHRADGGEGGRGGAVAVAAVVAEVDDLLPAARDVVAEDEEEVARRA
jgi:hypothetical protein